MKEFATIKNDTFYFKCAQCGNCCSGDQKVYLNLYDLYKLALFQKYDHSKTLFDAGMVILVKAQNDAFLPRIRFKLKPYQFCPFLIHEETTKTNFYTSCKLHPDYKPLICSLAPLGRVLDLDEETDNFIFVKPAPDCPGVYSRHKNSLKNIKKQFQEELDLQARFFSLLQAAKKNKFSRRDYLERLYYFDLAKPVACIFSEKEKDMELFAFQA